MIGLTTLFIAIGVGLSRRWCCCGGDAEAGDSVENNNINFIVGSETASNATQIQKGR